jgi:photosystem II stability/assembly factor-like uncharacterized protein
METKNMNFISGCFALVFTLFTLSTLPLQAQRLVWEKLPIVTDGRTLDTTVVDFTKNRFGMFALQIDSKYSYHLYYSHDNGRSWQNSRWKTSTDSALIGDIFVFTIQESFTKLFGVTGRNICVSSDSGKTWELVQGSIIGSSDNIFYPERFVLAALDTSIFAIYGSSLYRSDDFGKTWKDLKYYLSVYPQKDPFFYYGSVVDVRVDDRRIFLSTSDRYRLASDDNGKTWFDVTLRIPLPAKAEETWLSQLQPELILATQIIMRLNRAVYNYWLSNDSGQTWRPLTLLDTNTSISSFTSIGKAVFIGTSSGVFRTDDTGQTWSKESEIGLTGDKNLIYFRVDSKTLYAVIVRQGVYRADVSAITNVNVTSLQKLLPFLVAPNPTADFTDISFTLPRATLTRLSLYSTLGTEVWRNEGGILPAGEQCLRIDTRGLPSGVYMYRLTAGGVSSVGRIVVVR